MEREKQAVIDHLRSELRPDPEVLEPLHRLARRYGVAAVSSSADARIAASLRGHRAGRLLPAGTPVQREDWLPRPTSKPDPAIYRYAGERLGIGVHQGLAVEDSLPGASSAVAAGFATVGNLQFVPPDERKAREEALREIGVVAVVNVMGAGGGAAELAAAPALPARRELSAGPREACACPPRTV